MTSLKIDVNKDELIKYTKKLDESRKYDLPVVVKQTLNSLAFQFKKKDVYKQYKKKRFVERNKNFLKVATAVTPVKQKRNINTFVSKAGISSNRIKSKSAKNLAKQQEKGGKIEKRYIPTSLARVGNSYKKGVKKKFRFSSLGKIPKQNLTSPKRFMQRVKRRGKGSVVAYKGYLFYVKSIRGKNPKVMPIYKVVPSKTVNIEGRYLIKDTSKVTVKMADRYYIKHAKKRLK